VIVVDASVWVSRLVATDVHYEPSRRWLEDAAARGEQFIAPMILLPEVAGAVARRTADSAMGDRGVEILLRVPGLRLVSIDHRLGQEAARLAARHRLRGADAVYVTTASVLSVPLVTWDDEQRDRTQGLISVASPQEILQGPR
jgi:predicted nucleic acid-binding protein